MQVGLVLSWLVYQKNLLYLEKIMVFWEDLCCLLHIWTLSYTVDTCLVFLYMYGNQDIDRNADISFSQKFSLSIVDALSCINVQCLCMVCCVIVKLITYFFSGSTNACADCFQYMSFVLSFHIIRTKYITV